VILVSGNTKAYYFDNGVESFSERFAMESHEGSLMFRNRPTVVLADRGCRSHPSAREHRPTPDENHRRRGCLPCLRLKTLPRLSVLYLLRGRICWDVPALS
jgi:hypothetical protein